MKKRMVSAGMIEKFEAQLRSDEKSENTIKKYARDVAVFRSFAASREVSKAVVMEFKAALVERYEITSANSMIAAVNAFLRFMGWTDCCIKQFKVQRRAFRLEEKELTKAEYVRLVNTAKQQGNERLNLIFANDLRNGIRVSELRFITVEAVYKGEVVVSCKNKTRTVFATG